jgi:uncharacterized protein YcbX
MRIGGLWRFPVKSMQGEDVDVAEIGPGGVVGDRAYAVIDAADGKVASAKNPRKWAALLECRAEFVEPPSLGALPPVRVTLPDGTGLRSDEPDVDAKLSAFLGREVRLSATVPQGATFEETWPNIAGLAPTDFIESTRVRTDDSESVSDLALALAAPGTFFDLAPIHFVTSASLTALTQLEPESAFVTQRFRPNFLLETDDEGFVENGWVGATVELGTDARVSVMMPTMRCVMTTLSQPGLPADGGILRAASAHNRVEITGLGEWACVGAYASVATPGTVHLGDEVRV